MNHTPTPWRLERGSIAPEGEYCIMADLPRDPSDVARGLHVDRVRTIGKTFDFAGAEEATANARLIVRAVNNHDALLEACRDALHIIEGMRPYSMDGDKEVARAILLTALSNATKED